MITDTQAAYTSYFGNLTDRDTNLAIQKGRTVSMNNVFATFQHTVSQREGLVRTTYGKGSPDYIEFFPRGLSEFSDATLLNVEILMTRMINASTSHSADLGLALQTEFTGIYKSFETARGTQLGQKGTVSGDSDAIVGTQATVALQLTQNLLTIALANIGNKGAASMFFDESIIKVHEETKTPVAPPPVK